MARSVNDIIGLSEKYFVKVNKNRVTFFRADKRFKASEIEGGKVVYANKWVSRNSFDKMKSNLVNAPEISKTNRGKEILRGVEKVHFKPTKLSYSYKLDSTRKKHKSVFIAYTKEHMETFSKMIKDRVIPLQKEKGEPSKVIDLKEKTRAQKTVKEWKEEVSP